MGKTFGVNVVVGIPSFGMVSTYFLQARMSQQFPLVSSAVDKVVLDKPIAEARNEIVQYALDQGANYIFWLDDDVIPPPDAFLKMYMSQKDIVNGVYWSKSNPPMPLMFRNHLEGPYLDWHVGDFIEVDAAGNGLTLVKTDVYKKISEMDGAPGKWYSTEYVSFKEATQSASNNTEDLYFYWKAKKAGYKVWVDTSIQAYHYEKNSKVLYAMPNNARQGNPSWSIVPAGKKNIADIGSGPISPTFEDGVVTSFDIREDMKPSIVCDVRKLPVPDQVFDIVFSSHTLEHFSYQSADKVLKEWSRVLKVGGELRLVVPNLRYVAKRIWEDKMNAQDMWVLYGEQDYAKNFHAGGFTPELLKSLVVSLDMYEDIVISEGNVGGEPNPLSWNLNLTARKARHPVVENITPDWIDAPKSEPVWWPIKNYQEYAVRELEDEKEADIIKWAGHDTSAVTTDPALNIFYPNKGLPTEPETAQEPVEATVAPAKPKRRSKAATKPIEQQIEELAKE